MVESTYSGYGVSQLNSLDSLARRPPASCIDHHQTIVMITCGSTVSNSQQQEIQFSYIKNFFFFFESAESR